MNFHGFHFGRPFCAVTQATGNDAVFEEISLFYKKMSVISQTPRTHRLLDLRELECARVSCVCCAFPFLCYFNPGTS
ncbi:hypothetical protein Y032_0366g16 [Ancylostoma ceylanicum]|uniref:Uncharacterized protein n=1 Tax=Ancylostoma ceylanicum TaxID=53326 RepID=A0A016RVK7_9BILA|nr:hypothetical protein Y032_0366g16 [Ancylostoma ceylanicum]